jgi:hypothetical protein
VNFIINIEDNDRKENCLYSSIAVTIVKRNLRNWSLTQKAITLNVPTVVVMIQKRKYLPLLLWEGTLHQVQWDLAAPVEVDLPEHNLFEGR